MTSLSKRVLRKLKQMVVNTPPDQRVVSIQEFFESFMGNFMKEERDAAVRWRRNSRVAFLFFLNEIT
jgi:hypothetical protein